VAFLFAQKNDFIKAFRRIIAFIIILSFIFEQLGIAQVIPQIPNPADPNSLFISSDKFRPIHLRSIDYQDAARSFSVMLDKGDVKEAKQAETEQAVRDMMTYFFIGVRLPNSSFWVNLRPDSPERIIDARLAQTDIGRIMLAADVQLKKDLAAYTSPKTKEGKAYWDKLYKKAEELFGSEDISIPTMTRPWIVPDEIILRDAGTSAYIYKATLKVLLEADHLRNGPAIQFADPRIKTLNDYSSQIIKESILPKLSKDVNISRRYAPLRQVYYSLILAQWFKSRNMGIDKSIDQKDLAGLMSNTAWDKGVYFKQYQDSFQKGEYDLQETVRTPFGQTIRQYFSGGVQIGSLRPLLTISGHLPLNIASRMRTLSAATVVPHEDDMEIMLNAGKEAALFDGGKRMEGEKASQPEKVAASGKYSLFHDIHMFAPSESRQLQEELKETGREITDIELAKLFNSISSPDEPTRLAGLELHQWIAANRNLLKGGERLNERLKAIHKTIREDDEKSFLNVFGKGFVRDKRKRALQFIYYHAVCTCTTDILEDILGQAIAGGYDLDALTQKMKEVIREDQQAMYTFKALGIDVANELRADELIDYKNIREKFKKFHAFTPIPDTQTFIEFYAYVVETFREIINSHKSRDPETKSFFFGDFLRNTAMNFGSPSKADIKKIIDFTGVDERIYNLLEQGLVKENPIFKRVRGSWVASEEIDELCVMFGKKNVLEAAYNAFGSHSQYLSLFEFILDEFGMQNFRCLKLRPEIAHDYARTSPRFFQEVLEKAPALIEKTKTSADPLAVLGRWLNDAETLLLRIIGGEPYEFLIMDEESGITDKTLEHISDFYYPQKTELKKRIAAFGRRLEQEIPQHTKLAWLEFIQLLVFIQKQAKDTNADAMNNTGKLLSELEAMPALSISSLSDYSDRYILGQLEERFSLGLNTLYHQGAPYDRKAFRRLCVGILNLAERSSADTYVDYVATGLGMNIKLSRFLKERQSHWVVIITRFLAHRKAFNEIAYNLNREFTQHPSESRLNEDDKTGLFDLLFGIDDTVFNTDCPAADIEYARQVFDEYFRNDPKQYQIEIADVKELLVHFGLETIEKIIQGVAENPKQSLEEVMNELKIDDPQQRSRLDWIMSNLFVLQESIQRLKPIARQMKEKGKTTQDFVSFLEAIDKTKKFSALYALAAGQGLEVMPVFLLKLECFSPSQAAREEALAEALATLDGTRADVKLSLGALPIDARNDILRELIRLFEVQPEQSQLRIYMKVLFSLHTDNTIIGNILNKIRTKDTVEGLTQWYCAGKFLFDKRELVRNNEALQGYLRAAAEIADPWEKKKAFRDVRQLYLTRDKAANYGLEDLLTVLSEQIALSEPESKIPHVLFEPIVRMQLDTRLLVTVRLLIDRLNHMPETRNRTGEMKQELMETLKKFSHEKYRETMLWQQLPVFMDILTEKYNVSAGAHFDASGFYQDMVYCLQQYRFVQDIICDEAKNEKLAQDTARRLDELCREIRDDLLERHVIAREKIEALGQIMADLETDILLAQFSETVAIEDKKGFKEDFLTYMKNDPRIRWTDHGGRNILQLIREYFNFIKDKEIRQFIFEAFRHEVKGDFSQWKYESPGYSRPNSAQKKRVRKITSTAQADTGTSIIDEAVKAKIAELPNNRQQEFWSKIAAVDEGETIYEKLQLVNDFEEIGTYINTLRQGWEQPLRYKTTVMIHGKATAVFVVFTGDFYHLFNIGNSAYFSACQSCRYGDDLNRGLTGYTVNGNVKTVVVLDQNEQVITRYMVKLEIAADKNGRKRPVLLVEDSHQYGSIGKDKLYGLLDIVSLRCGISQVSSDGTRGILEKLRFFLIRGRTGFNYSDLYGSSVPGKISAGLYNQTKPEIITNPMELHVTPVSKVPREELEQKYCLEPVTDKPEAAFERLPRMMPVFSAGRQPLAVESEKDGGIRLSAVKGSERALVTAHDKGFTIQLLHDDIAQGVQDGDIVMPHGPLRDDYSMFQQGLDWTNTRIQAETPVYLLKAFMDIYEQCRIMVLGPGAGTELSHIDDIAQEQGRQVEVDTISLSPLPLRFRLELDSANLWEQVKAYTKAGFSLAGLEEYYALLSDREIGDITRINRAEFNRALRHGEHEKIPMSVIPPLQNAGFHIYSRLPTPHIHRQYIMPLTDILSGGFGIQKRYHIVLDNHGGFYYTVMTEGLDEAVRAVDMLLAPDGVFYARVVPWMKEELDEFEFPGLVIFVTSEELLRKRIEEPLRTLIVRKDSLHMRRLAGCSGVRQVSDGMYRVDKMDEFVKELIPANPFIIETGPGAAIREGLSTVVADNNPSHGAPGSLPSRAQSHKDGGTLSIPQTALNFAGQLPSGWQSSMRREYYHHQEHRQLAQDHMEALSQLGLQLQMKMANAFPARAESVGPVALNPACGGDVMLFGLSAITDIIGIDLQPFGPPEKIIAPQRTVNPHIKARYYALGTDAMETIMALPETGNLIVERILIGLNASVSGIYYFTLDDAGKMSFIDSPEMTGTAGFGNAVVEFNDESGLTKRYWYIQQDLNRRSQALRSFLEQTVFQSLVLKSAFDMFNPDSPLFPDHDNLIQTILEPARRHSAWVIHDESRDGNPYKMWQEQFKPYHVQRMPVRLRSGMIVKPFFGLSEKNVFWGPADYLKTSSHQRHRGEYYEIFCREMSRINPDKTDIDYQLEFDRWMFRHYRLIVPEPGPDDSMVFADMLKHPPEPESLNDTELYLAFQNAFWSRAFTQLQWDFYLFGHFGFGQYPKIFHKLLEPEAKAAIKQDRELLKLYYKSGAHAFRRIARIEARLVDEMFARFAPRPGAIRGIIEYLHGSNIPILDPVLNRLLGIRDYELEETLSPGIESSAAYQSEDHFYQGTPYELIRRILIELELTSSDVLVDLGSGYGRMVIYAALATNIKKAIGIELVAERASVSSRTAEELGLANVEFQNSHVKDADIQDGTVFYLFNPFSDETFALAMDKLREVAKTKKITMVFWQCNESALAQCTWMKLVKTVPYRSYTAYVYEADPSRAREVGARQTRQRDGGDNAAVFLSDRGQADALLDVFEIIERNVKGKSLPGDPAVISSGRGAESAVYSVAGYDRVVFKVMDEDLSEYRFNIQTDNLSRIAGVNGYTRVSFDGFDLVSTAYIAPFAYFSWQNASGKRIRMVVQQKAVMPLERDELDALKADLKRAGITWVDAGPRNAAMIESEHGGQTTRMPVVIDLGGLFFKDATAQLIEMLFNAPEADDRHSAASALWAQDPERVPVQVMDALKKASNSEKDPFARSVIKAILRSASMGQDSAQSQQNFYTQPRQDGKHIFELWQEKADVGSSITPAVYDDGYRANMVRLIKSVTRENKDAAILSIGSGIAFVEEILASDGYRNITAVDIHREAAEIARSKGLESFVATGESLPIGSSSQDVVYLDGALGHMAASFKAPYDNCFQQPLREVSRVLKDTGLVVISDDVPAEGSDYELNPRVELLRVSDTVIAQELKNAGFKVFDIQFFSYLRPGIGEVKRRVVVAQKADFAPQDVAGIDFIGLQAAQTQSMAGPLSARILTCLGQSVPVPISADLSQEWLKIEQAINAGTIPAVSSMEGYVKACCQSERIAAERNKVLLALAAILRLQEDLYIPTEPRLKELLVLLESPV